MCAKIILFVYLTKCTVMYGQDFNLKGAYNTEHIRGKYISDLQTIA